MSCESRRGGNFCGLAKCLFSVKGSCRILVGLLAAVLANPKSSLVFVSWLLWCVCSGGGFGPTQRAADTATPWGNVGGLKAR